MPYISMTISTPTVSPVRSSPMHRLLPPIPAGLTISMIGAATTPTSLLRNCTALSSRANRGSSSAFRLLACGATTRPTLSGAVAPRRECRTTMTSTPTFSFGSKRDGSTMSHPNCIGRLARKWRTTRFYSTGGAATPTAANCTLALPLIVWSPTLPKPPN